MSSLPRLTRLLLSRYRQFRFCKVDLEKIASEGIIPDLCLIGANGCGKSTLLAELYQASNPHMPPVRETSPDSEDSLHLAKYSCGEAEFFTARVPGSGPEKVLYFSSELETTTAWETLSDDPPSFTEFHNRFSDFLTDEPENFRSPSSAAWFSPEHNLLDGGPLDSFGAFVGKKWNQRESDFHHYLMLPENREKTISAIEGEFSQRSPDVLLAVEEVWNRILLPTFNRVELVNEEGPVVTRDGRAFPFSVLPAAVQRLLLEVGHLLAQRLDERSLPGVVFLDSPEEGLHPTTVLALLPLFRSLGPGHHRTILTATHSPLLASLFPPAQRLRLEHNENGHVTVKPGISAEGADPSQLLKSDFQLSRLEPPSEPVLVAAPATRYSKLKRAIQSTDDQDELADLIDEVMTMRKY
ncbi:MAG TPA: AAA family ATPase [Verrucomicrobiales bacterium]|nr:AAA family ATPase [Verrucomicrobiales bacterium]